MDRSQAHTEILAALGEIRSFLEEQAAYLQDGLDHAVEVMRENTEEVGVLRDAVDELRERYIWALNNFRQDLPPVFHLTSMPVDPCASEWSARVNRVAGVPVQNDPGGDVPGAAEDPTVRAAEPYRLADSFQAEQGRLF
ncbi:MAG: hypothetical protein AB7O68_14565 [Pirellulales bacterium]